MKKKAVAIILALVMLTVLLAACGDSTPPPAPPPPAPANTPGNSATPNNPSTPASPGDPGAAVDPNRPADYDTRTEIVIGAARPHSGIFQSFEDSGFGVFYQRWVADVNARGGLYIEEYGRQLPIRLIRYDDTSDMATMLMLTEKMMFEDKVDYIFPTCSSAMLAAQAALTSDNGYFMFSAEGGASDIVKNYQDYPYFFVTNAHSAHQLPALVDLFKEQGISKVFITYYTGQHGLEYWDAASDAFAKNGITIVNPGGASIPGDIQDMTPIIMQAQASDAQAYLQFAYQGPNYLAIETMQALNYNPEFMLFSNAICTEIFTRNFEPEIINGVSGWAAWVPQAHPAAAEFDREFRAANPGMIVDFWTHIYYDIIFDILEEAITKVGTLDNTALAEFMNSGYKFQTRIGEMWYVNNSMHRDAYLGQIGQWQNGRVELIGVGQRTAAPLVPKPEWP